MKYFYTIEYIYCFMNCLQDQLELMKCKLVKSTQLDTSSNDHQLPLHTIRYEIKGFQTIPGMLRFEYSPALMSMLFRDFLGAHLKAIFSSLCCS